MTAQYFVSHCMQATYWFLWEAHRQAGVGEKSQCSQRVGEMAQRAAVSKWDSTRLSLLAIRSSPEMVIEQFLAISEYEKGTAMGGYFSFFELRFFLGSACLAAYAGKLGELCPIAVGTADGEEFFDNSKLR